MRTISLLLIIVAVALATYYPTQKKQVSTYEIFNKKNVKFEEPVSIQKKPLNVKQEQKSFNIGHSATSDSESGESESDNESSDDDKPVKKKQKKVLKRKFKKRSVKYDNSQYTAPVYYKRR